MFFFYEFLNFLYKNTTIDKIVIIKKVWALNGLANNKFDIFFFFLYDFGHFFKYKI